MYSQKNNKKIVFKKDHFLSIEQKNIFYQKDPTFKKDLNSIKNLKFYKKPVDSSNYNANFWYRFSIKKPIKTKYFGILLNNSDNVTIYIPNKTGYKKYKCGFFIKGKPVKKTVLEKVSLLLKTDSIDFSKPFYYEKIMLSNYGFAGMNKKPKIIFTNHKLIFDGLLNKNTNFNEVIIYSGIIFFSFLLFFVSFLITKDFNYLHYSFYLIAVVIIFGIRTPIIFNFLNKIHPHLFFYLEDVSQIISSGLYFYFVVYFLDFKSNFPKLYTFSVYLLRSFIVFGILVILLNIFFPHSTFRFPLFNIYRIIFTIISLGIFFYLMKQKLDLSAKVVLFGSFLLIIGNFLTLILHDFTVFLNTAVIEIILFSAVISYKNKQTIKKNTLNAIALELEKNKKESLIELNQLKTDFFTNISHEFRTPLTLISGPVQKQLKRNNLNPSDKKDLQLIKQSADRLLNLVNQLLSFTKIESGSVKLTVCNTNLKTSLGKILERFKYLANEKMIQLSIDFNNLNTLNTWFNEDILEKIISNILSNAIKYTPKKGQIFCNISIEKEQLYIEIKNSGNTLSKEELNKIFNRFYQIDKNSTGVGIGLAYVQELLKLHKGKISVSSSDGFTNFKIKIPISENSYNNSEKEQCPTDNSIKKDDSVKQDIDSNKLVMLIVEDNIDVQNYLKELFSKDYKIYTANNGNEGINKAIKQIPDIILSDVMMPKKSGVELCSILKKDERTYHIPILLLTAKAGKENKYLGIHAGADDYIEKPFNNELLVLKVKKLLENIKKLQERFSNELILQPNEIAFSTVDELFLTKLQKILDSKLTNPNFNSTSFSKEMFLSRMQLHRKLKALFGLTTSEFILKQRLILATELLSKKNISIAQIAYAVGFNDPAYFSKKFKNYYNCTPTEYHLKNK